jgi:hypothetical protein
MWLTPESLYLISVSLVIIMKIVCFILSYKIIKLGYNLIFAGVKGEFKFASNFIGFKADLTSLSPGLLFVLLGVLLMVVAIYINKNVTLQTTKKPVTNSKTITPAFGDTTLMPGINDFPSKDSSLK